MGRWEWIILEVGFLGLLVWELVRTRLAIRKARAAKKDPAERLKQPCTLTWMAARED